MYIPKPSSKELEKYLDKFKKQENYVLQEKSLDKLFYKTYPKNNDINDVLIKASTLNDFYSTNIFSIFTVAKRIIELNIDERLNANDMELVNDIATISIKGKQKYFYSFATKYCSHHKPNDYPIYDYFVGKMMIYFNEIDKYSDFKKADLRNYVTFKKTLLDFKEYYELNRFTLKEIDLYLWQAGKEYFPKKY